MAFTVLKVVPTGTTKTMVNVATEAVINNGAETPAPIFTAGQIGLVIGGDVSPTSVEVINAINVLRDRLMEETK